MERKRVNSSKIRAVGYDLLGAKDIGRLILPMKGK
jgi:hypothetical protein